MVTTRKICGKWEFEFDTSSAATFNSQLSRYWELDVYLNICRELKLSRYLVELTWEFKRTSPEDRNVGTVTLTVQQLIASLGR